jgi:hypothetical protein
MSFIPYIRDSFRSGISDEVTRGTKGSFKNGYSLDIHKRRDSLSCNYAMKTIGSSSVIKDLIRYTVQAKDGTTYCFGSLGSIYAIAGDPADPVVTGLRQDENGEIKGAGEWQLADGNNYLVWATNTCVARAALNGALDTPWVAGVATQDYKTNLDPCAYHPIKNAAGNLIIGNGNFLASIDYTGNFNNATVNIRPGNVVKCLEERDDYVLIGSERVDESEEGHIWSWVATALNWIQKKKIPVKGVNALIDTERLLLQGGRDGELFYSDFQNTAPLNSVPTGGQCNSGVGIYNDLALFGIYGNSDTAGIYSYGRRMMNRPFAFNWEFRLAPSVAGDTVKEIGAVWTSSSAVFASWKVEGSVTQYGVDMISSSTRATARYEGLEFTGGQPHLKKSYLTEKVVMEPLPAGCSVNVLYKPNRQTTGGSSSAGEGWKYAKVADGTGTTYSVEGSTEAEFIINDNAKVYEMGIEITPSGTLTPEITALVGYLGDKLNDH